MKWGTPAKPCLLFLVPKIPSSSVWARATPVNPKPWWSEEPLLGPGLLCLVRKLPSSSGWSRATPVNPMPWSVEPLLSPGPQACVTMVVPLDNSRTPYKNRSPAKKMRSLKRLISFLCRKMSQPRLPSHLSICPQMQLSFLPGDPKKNLSISQVNTISILPECPTPTQHSLCVAKEKPLTLNDLMSYCNKASSVSSPERIKREQERKQDMKKFKNMLGLPPWGFTSFIFKGFSPHKNNLVLTIGKSLCGCFVFQ